MSASKPQAIIDAFCRDRPELGHPTALNAGLGDAIVIRVGRNDWDPALGAAIVTLTDVLLEHGFGPVFVPFTATVEDAVRAAVVAERRRIAAEVVRLAAAPQAPANGDAALTWFASKLRAEEPDGTLH